MTERHVNMSNSSFQNRLKKGKELEKEEAIQEVKKNIHLIKAPHAGMFNLSLNGFNTVNIVLS